MFWIDWIVFKGLWQVLHRVLISFQTQRCAQTIHAAQVRILRSTMQTWIDAASAQAINAQDTRHRGWNRSAITERERWQLYILQQWMNLTKNNNLNKWSICAILQRFCMSKQRHFEFYLNAFSFSVNLSASWFVPLENSACSSLSKRKSVHWQFPQPDIDW